MSKKIMLYNIIGWLFVLVGFYLFLPAFSIINARFDPCYLGDYCILVWQLYLIIFSPLIFLGLGVLVLKSKK